MIRPFALPVVAVVALGACSWVEMEPQGREIRVAMPGQDLSYCERRGEVTVSVRERIGFFERNELKVRDELEVLARNEAPRLQADTVQALEEPIEGEQRFAAYRCRGGTTATRETAPAESTAGNGGAETFPLRND